MKTKNFSVLLFLLLIVMHSVAQKSGSASLPPVPAHPGKIKYDSLKWNVPLGEPYRIVLKNGLRAYVASDSSLPLIQITGYVKYGNLLDPKGKEGLSSLLAIMMRSGGTEKYPADTLDKIIDQLAMKFTFSSAESQFLFNVSFLSDYTDTAFKLLEQILFHPAFDQTKIDKNKSIYIESIRHRFDNPAPTLDAAYQKVMYPQTAASTFSTEKSIKSITRDDLIKMHRKYMQTNNIIFSIAGNFEKTAMISRLEKVFPDPVTLSDTVFPVISTKPAFKALLVNKPISQAYVRLGLPLFKRPDPDYYPVSVLNMILGGGGFTSRLGTKIRSDEGLTYSIYSSAESNYTYPGTFYIDFFTKTQSFTRATYLSLEEMRKLLKNGVTADELINAKASLIEELPSMFRTPFDIVSTYAWNEYYGRSPDHFKKYRDEISAITREDISRVAQKYLSPDNVTFTIVGDTAALLNSKDSLINLQKLTPQKIINASDIPQLP